MVPLGSQYPSPSNFVLPSFISFIFVLLSQFALTVVPRYFFSFPLLAKLVLSGFGRCCKRLVRVYASAPAFVFFNFLFIWGVYIFVIREAIPSFSDVVFNAELSLLMIGYYRILRSDPGLVPHESSSLDTIMGNINSEVKLDSEEEELSPSHKQHSKEAEEGYPVPRRVRYCRHCKAYIWGFDHHCPAFGNCIGQKNHALFMALLVGFIIAEASYVVLSTQFVTKSQSMDETVLESNPASNLATSTMLFCLLQVPWQVVFLIWHIYCICFNIKTDEWAPFNVLGHLDTVTTMIRSQLVYVFLRFTMLWEFQEINWNKYPEFQLTLQCQPGSTSVETKFRNPYDRGILSNVNEFLAASKSQFWCTC
ncbi:probable protein S-acyltransferase 16 isoform X2 [Macadamia integrifolia]|uniref:probable protein S-acyltransferase 16 isoform X2 n=1 Tax=Macadamia integrifolia TaxID=60698 RepID=UPI001C4F18FC|nr:probable protein S-acyltransferase 16 isoform X2 [Macadamia integrifolia]